MVTGLADTAIEVEWLSFGYQDGGPRLIDISLSVRPGQVCCLLGPNARARPPCCAACSGC